MAKNQARRVKPALTMPTVRGRVQRAGGAVCALVARVPA
jgi:hypothetical protein